jgi:arylsulfatase A-like enzyme
VAGCRNETPNSEDGAGPTPTQVAPIASAPSATAATTATVAMPSPPTAPAKPLNVLFLTVDSLRSHMPWTGYERDIAPNLTALAKESVVYTDAYAVSSYTAKSVAAMFTGRYPSSVYRSGWFFATLADSNVFFTEILQQHGIRTMGGHGHAYFDRGKQLNQGFDVWQVVDGIDFDSETDKHVTSDKMTDLAIKMLSDTKNTGGQFFLWFHYMDPHDQYIQHQESPVFGKKARDRYDAEIHFTDRHLGRLFEFAKKQPWYDQTAIVLSADHGEAFGEHDMYKHAFEVWEVLTRVPLFVTAPGAKPRVIKQRRSHIDLAPTFLGLMGVADDRARTENAKNVGTNTFVGKSMVPEIYGAEPDNREPIVLDLPEDRNNPERRAIIQGDYKLIVKGDGRKLLFNLKTDPGELKDLAKAEVGKLAEMQKLYDKTWQGIDIVAPYGGMKLRSGKVADGPEGPKKN